MNAGAVRAMRFRRTLRFAALGCLIALSPRPAVAQGFPTLEPPVYEAPVLPPLYHARDHDSWDFWYAKHGDLYYAYYLQSPIEAPVRFTHSTVGLATSPDLIHWTEVGEVLRANPPGQWNDAWIATGSVWGQANQWRMLFTGRTYTGQLGFGLAESADLVRWTRVGDGPVRLNYQPFVVPASEYWQRLGHPASSVLNHTVLADPYVLPEPIDGWYYMVANSIFLNWALDTRGGISMWRSRDGAEWEDLGIVAALGYAEMEAPQIWKHGDRWYMVAGAAKFTPRTLSTLILSSPNLTGPYEPIPNAEVRLPNYSGWFYVAKVIQNPQGQDVLLGGVGGRMSRPYPLIYEPDGSITLASFDPVAARWVPGGLDRYTGPVVPDGSGGVIGGGAHRINAGGYLVWQILSAATADKWAVDSLGGAVGVAARSGDLYGLRTSGAGAALWGSGVPVCTAPLHQGNPAVAAAGDGGALFAWIDIRNGVDFDVYAQRLDAAGAPQWTVNGVAVAALGGAQLGAAVLPDGSGGAFVAWSDGRTDANGGPDLYLQRLNAAGVPQWGAGGIAVATVTGTQEGPTLARDGAGGVFVAWSDTRDGLRDVYLQRIHADGTAAWMAGGILVGGGVNDQMLAVMAPDGVGGVFVAWEDHRIGRDTGLDIYAQRVDMNGTPLWRANGIPVASDLLRQTWPSITPDGAGGALVAWLTQSEAGAVPATYTTCVQRLTAGGLALWRRDGVPVELQPTATTPRPPSIAADATGGVYVDGLRGLQRVLPDGRPAWVPNFTPSLERVEDVTGDEGGFVRLAIRVPFSQTIGLAPPIAGYGVWRRISRVEDGLDPVPPEGWELVSSFLPPQTATFFVLAPTRTDASATDPGYETYSVVAQTVNPPLFLPSVPVPGQSFDNRPPQAPTQVTGTLAAETRARIVWSPAAEADFWHYRVYKGATASFTPDASNRIGLPVTPEWEDATFERAIPYYKVTTVDRHGNESIAAPLTAAEWIEMPLGIPVASYLASFSPNPVRQSGEVEFGLARAGRARLIVYDPGGRRVCHLVDGTLDAGVWRSRWNGRDDDGRRLPAGVYLLHLSAPGIDRTQKVVLAE